MKLSEGIERLGGIEGDRVHGQVCKCCNRETLYAMRTVFVAPGSTSGVPAFWAWCGNCGSLNSLVHDGLMIPTVAGPS